MLGGKTNKKQRQTLTHVRYTSQERDILSKPYSSGSQPFWYRGSVFLWESNA